MSLTEATESNVVINPDLTTIFHQYIFSKSYSQILILVDENTEKHCLPKIIDHFDHPVIIKIQSGEENKTLDTCTRIWDEMTNNEVDRKGLLINLGGGVIGDMGGFCASVYKRGIDFIQMPTTLLSQVDASVGGKLGIDFHGYKNHIGMFRIPEAVVIISDFLKTLPENELRSGFAEVIKHCLIADAEKWNVLQNNKLHGQDWPDLIEHSVAIKNRITQNDPMEKGLRKILNFGHTLGHAIESYFLNTPNRLLHGEAIAIGMVCESYISYLRGFIKLDEAKNIKDYILSIYDHHKINPDSIEELKKTMKQDKKNESNVVLFSLLYQVGEANYNIAVNNEEIENSITFYNE